jgi:membrane-associated phospholipid phosphatase
LDLNRHLSLGDRAVSLTGRMIAPTRSLWPPFSRLAIGAAITIAAVAVVMVLLDPLVAPYTRNLPHGLVVVFQVITDFGRSGWFLIPSGALLAVIAALASPKLGRTTYLVLISLAVRLGFIFLAVGLPSLFASILKRLIGRARPLRVDGVDIYFAPFSWRVDYASLPSGHSTTAFAAAVALGALFPRARVILWIYAGLIALSRVVLSAHYPSDVIAGAVVGACGALLVRAAFATRRRGFSLAPDGIIRAMPGPSLPRMRAVARRAVARRLAGQ